MPLDDVPPAESGEKLKHFKINSKELEVRSPEPTGRHLLEVGDFLPPSDHVLVQLMFPGSRLVGLDDDVDLHHPVFRAFRSDRAFAFTVEERAYVWGEGAIAERELREMARLHEDQVFYLEREDVADELIEPGSVIDLKERGTEHFRIGKRLVTVFYRDEPFELKRGVYTGAELAAIFKVPAGYVLDLVVPNDFKEIGPNDPLWIREGMHFVSHPPKGQSS